MKKVNILKIENQKGKNTHVQGCTNEAILGCHGADITYEVPRRGKGGERAQV